MKYSKGDLSAFHKAEDEIYAEAAAADWTLQELWKKDQDLKNYLYDFMEAKTLYYEETARIYREMYTKIMRKMEEHDIEREEAELEHHMRRRYARQLEQEEDIPDERDLENMTNIQLIILMVVTIDAIIAVTGSAAEASVQYLRTRAERIAERMAQLDEGEGGGGAPPPTKGLIRPPAPRRR